jgi:hypothetical protein
MIGQKLRGPETRFHLEMVRYNGLSCLVRESRWRSNVGGKGDDIDRARSLANTSANHQAIFIREIFQDLGEACLEALGTKFRGPLQNLPVLARLHGDAAELAEQRLLP